MEIEKSKIDQIILAIGSVIDRDAAFFEDISIKTGLSGFCLYNFLVGEYFGIEKNKQMACVLLDQIFQKINSGYVSPTIFEEMVEFGHLLILCKEKKWILYDVESTLDELDSILENRLKQLLEKNELDPGIGAIKYGYYFLKRRPKLKKADEIVSLILDRININCKTSSMDGVYWITNIKKEDSIYFGISHGNAAYILFLLAAREIKMNLSLCDNLIRGAMKFILKNEQVNSPLFFPIMLNEPDRIRFPNYFCYGDLGTLYSIIKSEIIMHSEVSTSKLVKTLHILCDRIFDGRFITEGFSLLYGWSGLAMLYKKLGGLLMDEKCMIAYNSIVEHIINSFNPEHKYLGYSGSWNQNKKSTNISFSEGLIGISIFLMSLRNPYYEKYFENYFNL